ncbi:hypothetical protein EC957_009761 [Mortierella hygrophila]|uniref:Extracellular membrane protein CFEM domain-containing protein n=1 Tax=Mortierella hygrophila TaxID=979708 RepID=A0A9P6K562_9FUNG|nr:hypothetical protein EC957_009761 [Mortierella hygrophila]
MRCSTILAATTMVILSVVSAQTVLLPACIICIENSAFAAAPACKGLEDTELISPSAALSDKQKSCLCGLTANKTWIEGCIGEDKCPAGAVKLFRELYEASAAVPGTCDNVSTSGSANDASRFCGASSVKIAAAGAAAVAIAGALL